MKPRYIVGSIIGVLFLILAIYSFDSSKIEYTDFLEARETGKTVQVIGSWVKEHDYDYDVENNQFIFYMEDEESNVTKIIFDGGKPNNFDIAPELVIKGKFNGDVFRASEILTKCPSKYEGDGEELKSS